RRALGLALDAPQSAGFRPRRGASQRSCRHHAAALASDYHEHRDREPRAVKSGVPGLNQNPSRRHRFARRRRDSISESNFMNTTTPSPESDADPSSTTAKLRADAARLPVYEIERLAFTDAPKAESRDAGRRQAWLKAIYHWAL